MTILYGAVQGVAAIKAEALSIHEGKKPRYHLRAGLEYLFYDASKLTSERKWAWVGTVEQARKCRRDYPVAAGCRLRSIQTIPVHSEEAQ